MKNKTTNFKADTIIDIVQTLNELKESGVIQFVNYKWDEENNTFDINLVPKQGIKYVNIDLSLSHSGATITKKDHQNWRS